MLDSTLKYICWWRGEVTLLKISCTWYVSYNMENHHLARIRALEGPSGAETGFAAWTGRQVDEH